MMYSAASRTAGERLKRTQLPEEVIGQRHRRGEEILNRGLLDFLVIVGGAEAGVEVILEIGAEVDFVEGVFLFFLAFGDGLGFDGAVAVFFCARDIVEQRNVLFQLLENGILGDLGLDHLLQLQLVQGEHADHLHQPGRQDLALCDLKAEFWLKKYHSSSKKRARSLRVYSPEPGLDSNSTAVTVCSWFRR